MSKTIHEKLGYAYKKDGKYYWQWKYGAEKSLKDIIQLRELMTRFYHDPDSDKNYVKMLKRSINRYFLFLEERDNPIEFEINKELIK